MLNSVAESYYTPAWLQQKTEASWKLLSSELSREKLSPRKFLS